MAESRVENSAQVLSCQLKFVHEYCNIQGPVAKLIQHYLAYCCETHLVTLVKIFIGLNSVLNSLTLSAKALEKISIKKFFFNFSRSRYIEINFTKEITSVSYDCTQIYRRGPCMRV